MRKFRGFFVGGIALLLLVGAGCTDTKTAGSSEPIKLGWLGPLSGDLVSLGTDARIAAEMAVDEVNAGGGINGRPIQLIVEDGKCNPKDGVTAGTKLLDVDTVVAIVGGTCSGETTGIAPLVEARKIPIVSGCSSAPAITNAGDYIFRSYPSDAYQGRFGAEYLYQTLGKKRVALLAIQNEWGSGIKETFTKGLKELGGEVVLAESFSPTTRDFRTLATKIKESNADAIYLAGQIEDSIAALRQIQELQVNLPLLGADGWDDAKIHESGYAEGVMYTVPALAVTDEWTKKLEERGGNASVCAPRAYDNVKLFADVIADVGTDGEDIKDALYKVKDFPGVNGPITFDNNGDPVGAAYEVKIVRNKKAEFLR